MTGTRARRYLEAAVSAGDWLERAAVDTPEGPAWPILPGQPDTITPSLYGSGAGVALFFAELAAATGEVRYGELARQAARFVSLWPMNGQDGLYTGYAGRVLAVARVAEALEDVGLAESASGMTGLLLTRAEVAGAGLEWPAWPDGRGPWWELYHGSAGIALVLEEVGERDSAVSAGLRLAELAVPAEAGCWWRSRPDDTKPAPNIAHGTAGIAYTLASLALATGEEIFASSALDGAAYLLSVARTEADTIAVHHHEGDGRDLYTLGFCSGPPGLGCLFVRLHQLTGDPEWLRWAQRAARTVMTSGLPARLRPGFWDNVAQCCGSAGVADYCLGLYGLTADQELLDFAVLVLDDVLDRAVVDETGMRWHNVEHTVDPPELPAQTGWMQGAAGIGASLLRAQRVLTASPSGPWLPSWPF